MAYEEDAGKSVSSDEKILEQAKERLKRCIDDYSEERAKQKDDLLFSTLEQWPSAIRAEREGDPNGARPCLTIDHINQYIVQVVNDMRQNRPAVKVRPVDDAADIDTAEVFQGIIRQIEDQSTAQVAYATAGESAVRVGEGYFRIITEYEDEKSFDQVIRVRRVPDMFCVYLGPHMMPDGSDAEYGFVFEDVPIERFRREYPSAKYQSTDFSELEQHTVFWGDDKKIKVCEYFYFDYRPETVLFVNGKTMTKDEYEALADPKPETRGTRNTRIRTTKWCKLTGAEILEKRDWAGKYIPIVKVIGKESWVDGKRITWGLVRPAKDSLRMYNYWSSTITEKIALAPKTPYIGASGQFEGFEDRWGSANRINYPYLEYKAQSVDGLSVPPPQRQAAFPMEVAMVEQLKIIREDVQASLGMFKASLGKEQPNQSGRAILALTRESDTGTYHFSDNQSIAIQHGGRILVDLIPKIYDTGRIVKILGEDGKMSSAQIDPESPVAARHIADITGKIKNIYNLKVGTYDVTVTVGPSFNTKRMEAATLFTDLGNTAKDPASATVMRYLAVKNSDVPGADQAAEMLEKLLPPGLVKQEGQPQLDPQTAQAMQQMKQVIQLQGQKVQELESGAAVEKVKIQTKAESDKISIDADHDIKVKKLALDELVEKETARINREKAEAELDLKEYIARRELAIKEMVAAASVDSDIDVALERVKNICVVHETKMKGVIEQDNAENGNGSKNRQDSMQAMSKQFLDGVGEIITALQAKKRINLIKKDGQITGADVTVTNG